MTASPPFMSEAPRPQSVSPSRRGRALSLGGTVSRWPARTRRWARPSSVRATTLSPTRSTVSHEQDASAFSTRVGDSRLVVGHRRDGHELGRRGQKIARCRHRQVLAPWSRSTALSCALSWRSPSVRRLITRTQGTKNSPPGYSRRRLARMATHQGGTTPRRDLLTGLGVDDRESTDRGSCRRRAPPPAHAGSAGDHATAAHERVVLHHDGDGIGGLEHATDTHAAGEVHPLTDLGAGGDGGPGVDHGAGAHIGADVDVGGHQHDAAPEEGTPAGRRSGQRPAPPPRRSRA